MSIKIALHFTIIYLSALLISCGKSGVPAYPAPSFAELHLWLSGPPAAATMVGAYLQSYRVEISGCSNASDNKIVAIIPEAKPYLENLTEASTGCVASLLDFVYGPEEEPDTYTPEDSVAITGARGVYKDYVGATRKDVVTITIESALSAALGHNEKANFSAMPEKGENRLPEYVTSYSFQGASELPNVLISELVDGGELGGNGHGVLAIVECLEPRALSTCGTQSLLDLRFWTGIAPDVTPVISDATTLALNDVTLIIPHEIELWRNGFRFNLSLPKNSDGNFATKAALMVRFGDSYRYMVLEVDKLFPDLF
jgi:hypothetical protein